MERNRNKPEIIADFLRNETTLALATCGTEGDPQATPLFYVPREGMRLYWFSSPTSRHSRNLSEDPRSAVTVYHRTADWRKIRGVQMRGTAAVVSDAGIRRTVAEAYMKRFRLGKRLQQVMSQSALYCFRPEWVRYLDNSRGFGFQFEISCIPRKPGSAEETTASEVAAPPD